jgi:excisionase family DNA binding protein
MAVVARPKSFLSPAELAELLGVPIGTLYDWRYRRQGPRAHRIGRHLRYRIEDVEAWLAEHADPPRNGSAT